MNFGRGRGDVDSAENAPALDIIVVRGHRARASGEGFRIEVGVGTECRAGLRLITGRGIEGIMSAGASAVIRPAACPGCGQHDTGRVIDVHSEFASPRWTIEPLDITIGHPLWSH